MIYKETHLCDSPKRIICLHGFMGSCKDWEPLTHEWKKEYEIWCYDLPGHGKSLFQSDLSLNLLENLEDLAWTIIQDVPDDKHNFLVGYSMGGRLGFQLLVNSPQTFTSAVIESAHPGILSPEDSRRRYQADIHLLSDVTTEEEFESFLYSWYQKPLFAGTLNSPKWPKMLACRKKNCPRELEQALRLMSSGKQKNLWSKVSELKLPMLYITGEQDVKYTKIARSLEKEKYITPQIWSDCGHNVHWQQPEAFARVCQKFFGEYSSFE